MTLRLGRLTVVLLLAGLLPGQIFVSPSPLGNDATGDGSQIKPYLTVTKAASVAAAGATIKMTAGIHGLTEQIEFTNKNLTLIGAGTGVTIVSGHATLTKSYPSGGLPGVATLHRVGITVNGPARIDMRDFTLDMANNFTGLTPNTADRLYGLLLRNGGDATVDNVEITNAKAAVLDGTQGCFGIVVRGDNISDRCEARVRRCYVHDFGKGGIVVSFNALAYVDDNTFAGSGPTSAVAQNCIQVSNGAQGLVRQNTCKNVFFIPVAFTAAGILLFDQAVSCLVESNFVNNCQTGILTSRSGVGSTPTTIRGNSVSDCMFGIEVLSTTTVEVSDNTIHGASTETAFDSQAGNFWFRNNYSDWSGVGSYVIPGGGNSDAARTRGYLGLGNGVNADNVAGIPVDVVVANFGGTAALDWATANEGIGGGVPSITWGINTGFPSFTTAAIGFGSPGELPVGIATGHFFGPLGTRDLVVATNSNRVYYFNNNGLGGFILFGVINGNLFVPPFTIVGASDIAAGDFNGDGVDDAVVSYLGTAFTPGGATVLQSNPGPSIGLGALPGPFLGQCKSVVMGFIDGGAARDIVVTEGSAGFGRLRVYLGLGTGIFTEATAAPISSPIAVDIDPTSVTVFDWDNDGRSEIGVTCMNGALPFLPGSAIILRNNLPGGAFVRDNYRVNGSPQSIVAGNLGADSDPDTVRTDAFVANFVSKNVSVLSNYGRAGFEGNFSTSIENFNGSGLASPRALGAGDMNGDGRPDLVIADAGHRQVRYVLTRDLARNDIFGEGCPGTGGRKPIIGATGAPMVAKQPNPWFTIEVVNGVPLAPAVLILSAAPAAGPYPGCTFLLAGTDVVISRLTNGLGETFVPIPVPGSPSLIGGVVYFQWGVLDSLGGFVAALSLTEGLKVRVGF